MLLLDQMAERRIEEALERGTLDNLPGAGAPLDLDDDALVPGPLRPAYRLLKNAGYLPPELEAHAEIREVESLLCRLDDAERRAAAAQRLSLLRARLGDERCAALAGHGDYYQSVAEKLGGE